MIKRLSAYKKSPIMDVNITYRGEKVNFNLYAELKISEEGLNDSLTTQSQYYGFCLMLHKKFLTLFEEAKLNRNKVYGRLFLKAKSTMVMNGRPYSDDAAKAWVETKREYLDATRECIKAKNDADVLFTCIKSFEQRKDLLQSLSSNIRMEK